MTFILMCAERTKITRCGAKLVKADLRLPTRQPEVCVLENAVRWRVLRDEEWYGVNAREFFFTLEAEGKLAPPQVEVRWPGVGIARVLGTAGAVEQTADGVRFRMHEGLAPTSVRTTLKYGPFIHMAIFHNWEVRRAGPYRGGKWPAEAIQAQLNFLFGAREMCRAMGYESTNDPGFVGDIRLYGFETNFPNGHTDHPPHFHIMLAWPGWLNTQVAHFHLDDAGRIVVNDFQTDDGKKVTGRKYAPGEVCKMIDCEGKVGFELIVTERGEGVIMRRPASQVEFRLSPDSRTGSALTAVEVSRRDTAEGAWKPLCWVRVTDAADRGELRIIVRPHGGEEKTEVIYYDPDTGEELGTNS